MRGGPAIGIGIGVTHAPGKGVPTPPSGYALMTETVGGVVYYRTETVGGVVYYLMEAV